MYWRAKQIWVPNLNINLIEWEAHMQSINKKKQVSNMIKKCIYLVDDEINLHMAGKEADADISTLIEIKKELEKMCEVLSPKEYMPDYDYIIRDSLWDFMKVGEELLKVYYKYLEI